MILALGSAVIVPAYGQTVSAPFIVQLAQRLEVMGLAVRRSVVLTGNRPSSGYRDELAALRSARDELRAAHPGPTVLIGRSFGGRMCAFLAREEPPDALVIVSHPISPHGVQRPDDEAALASVRCSTLVVQGDRDEFGPIATLEGIAASNPLIDLVVLANTGHALGARRNEAIEHIAQWLSAKVAHSRTPP